MESEPNVVPDGFFMEVVLLVRCECGSQFEYSEKNKCCWNCEEEPLPDEQKSA